MAKRVTGEDIQRMVALYEEIGKYSEVARQVGFSASTVSKYIKENKASQTLSGDEIEPSMPTKAPDCSVFTSDEFFSYEDMVRELKGR